MNLKTFLNLHRMHVFVTVFGFIYYIVRSVHYAYVGEPNLDEGMYLYKGWLLASGQYIPYQIDGPYLSHALFSYLIPGYIQVWFGPGIYTARFFMVLLGGIMLFGLWLTARRLGGPWAGAIAVWAMAYSPHVSLFSKGVTQLLVATCLAWILFLILGEGRNWKHIVSAGFLAGVLVMIRHNMLLAIPFMAAYVYWQYGLRAVVLSALPFLVLFISIHSMYWPEILILWARWLPFDISAFGYIPSAKALSGNTNDIPLTFDFFLRRTIFLFQSIKGNLTTVLGMVFVCLGWPRHGWGKTLQKPMIFLFTTMIFLYIAHAWAALGKNYCPTCLNVYTPFLSPIGVLLLSIFLVNIQKIETILPSWFIGTCLVVISAGLGISTFEVTGWPLMEIPVPLPGRETPVLLWQIFSNRFKLEPGQLRMIFPLGFGFIIGILIVFTGYLLVKLKIFKQAALSMMIALLAVFQFFTPAVENRLSPQTCSLNVMAAYETVGLELRRTIPPGSRVYWAGYSPVPLLYLPDIKIYPALLNGEYSFQDSENFYRLRVYGLWNNELAQAWLSKADYVILYRYSDANLLQWMGERFEHVEIPNMPETCYGNIEVHLYRKK